MKRPGSIGWDEIGSGAGWSSGSCHSGRKAEAAGPELLSLSSGELSAPSRRVAPCKLCGRLLVPWSLWFPAALALVCSFWSLGSQGSKTLGWGGCTSKATGAKEWTRLQLHPGLTPDSFTFLLINHLLLRREFHLLVFAVKTYFGKHTPLKIIMSIISGHLSPLGTVPNAFHVFVSHSTLSAIQRRKVLTTVDTVLQMRLNRARIQTQAQTKKSVFFTTRLHSPLLSLSTSWQCWEWNINERTLWGPMSYKWGIIVALCNPSQ